MQRIEVSVGADFPPDNGDFAELVIEAGGQRHATRKAKPLGHPSQPMDEAARRAKFLDLATPVLGHDAAARTWACLNTVATRSAAEIDAALAA